MKFIITLFCLTSCITTNAAQVAKVLTEEQQEAAQKMFQLIYDKNNVNLKKLLQKYPGIANEMPEVRILLRTGFDPYYHFGKNHISALHYAIKENNHEALCLLLEYHADPDIQYEYDKETPLMWAAYFSDFNCAKTLIAAGADKELKNENQKTALDAFRNEDTSFNLRRPTYKAAIKEYHQAIADGEAERDRYAAEKQAAFKEIQNFVKVKELTAIVCGYAYGILPQDLPKSKAIIAEKSLLESQCAIQ